MNSEKNKKNGLILSGELTYLCPLSIEAIADRLLWNTVDIGWKYLDNPAYVHQSIDRDEYIKKKAKEVLENLRFIDGVYTALEIYTTTGKHIGFINCYPFPDSSTWPQSVAIGIIIPSKENHALGYGTEALALYTEYLFVKNIGEIHVVTQQTNTAMICAAGKIGFVTQSNPSDITTVLHMVKRKI